MRFSFREQEASRERSRGFMVGLGLVGVGMFVAFAWIGFTAPNRIPGRSYYYLYTMMKDADNITPHNQVRVDGDIVGQVLNPTVTHGLARLELQLDPQVAPLRASTTVEVLPRSAVGVRYIEITPGATGRKLPSGATLPASQASATEDLDTALSTFNPATRRNLQMFLQNFGEGLAGQGQNLNDALGGAPEMLAASGDGSQDVSSASIPAGGFRNLGASSTGQFVNPGTSSGAGAPAMLQSSGGVFSTIAAHHGYTARLVRGGGTISDANYPVRQVMATGFHPEAEALKPFDDTSAVDATLRQAPPTLNAAATQLPAVNAMATQLDGFATAVTPGLRAAPGAFGQTSALLLSARPELVQAKQVLNTVSTGVNPLLGLLTNLHPVLSPIRTGLANLSPIIGSLGQHGCDFLNFGKNWTSGMQYGNSSGNVLRFQVISAVFYGAQTPTAGITNQTYPDPCAANGAH